MPQAGPHLLHHRIENNDRAFQSRLPPLPASNASADAMISARAAATSGSFQKL